MTRWPQLQLCRRTSNIATESPRRVAVVSEAKEEAHLPTESLAGQAARRAVDVAHVHRGRSADEADVCWMGGLGRLGSQYGDGLRFLFTDG
jgi:hypothetical protein